MIKDLDPHISDDMLPHPIGKIDKCELQDHFTHEYGKHDEDIIQYIFHPGFSTKEQVTEVSGRGVGMDVVKTNIEGMSGTIKVTTEMGKGSVFKISLPLTMAIIDGMIVRIGSE